MTLSLDRRSVLGGATAALAATGLSARLAPKRFFQRMGKPIGLELYILGDLPLRDLDGTLANVARAGYGEIELPSLLSKTPQQLRAAADRAGLRISSLHVPMPAMAPPGAVTLADPPQKIADMLAPMGVHDVVLPITPFPPSFARKPGEDFRKMLFRSIVEGGADHWLRTADMLNRTGAALKPFGITLGYHNHNLEFAPVTVGTEQVAGIDLLLAHTEPGLVYFEVDVGWAASAGRDPAALLLAHKGRVRWVHLKDLTSKSADNFALSIDSTEIGSGRLDWVRILRAAEAAGVQHYFVEQEPPFVLDRMESARRSCAYLANLRA